jgi:ABC-type ATPase involved in cell division
MAEEVLRFENVWYTGNIIRDHVDNISFSLSRGEGMLISGPEGSGKSLILDLVMAKRLPTYGRIFYDGATLDLTKATEVEKLRYSIGYVTQTVGLINNLSVLENIILPLRYHTEMKDEEMFFAAEIWIDRYELGHKKNARPVALTASEMMRTAIIRALIVEPRILLLDSIVDTLCPLASRRMLELLFEDIRLRNITHIFSSYHPTIFDGHDLKFMLLYRGEVVFQGNLAEIKTADNIFLEQYRAYRTQGPMPPFNPTL